MMRRAASNGKGDSAVFFAQLAQLFFGRNALFSRVAIVDPRRACWQAILHFSGVMLRCKISGAQSN